MNNIINFVHYTIGDIVIAKNKDPDVHGNKALPKKVTGSQLVESDDLNYQLIYFEGETFPASAWDYEPYDNELRAQYYKVLKEIKSGKVGKTKSKSDTTSKSNKKNTSDTFINTILNGKK